MLSGFRLEPGTMTTYPRLLPEIPYALAAPGCAPFLQFNILYQQVTE